jgi:hypothetical protein
METASFDGLLKAIFYILLFYYVIKFLARLFLPILAKKVVEKASQQFQQQQNFQNQNQRNPYNTENQTNETRAESERSTTKPKEKKIVGDYVDFEEIE